VKANTVFGGYSDRAWRAISREVERVCWRKWGLNATADKVTLWRSTVPLRAELEQAAQDYYLASSSHRPTPTQHRQFLESKRRLTQLFQRSVVEGSELPEALQDRAAAIVSEIKRLYLDRIENLAGQGGQSAHNAAKAPLNDYFEKLVDIWTEIGGELENKKLLVSFIEACARPVVMDKRSTTRRAITARLRRQAVL
jgi:hypothetical protein